MYKASTCYLSTMHKKLGLVLLSMSVLIIANSPKLALALAPSSFSRKPITSFPVPKPSLRAISFLSTQLCASISNDNTEVSQESLQSLTVKQLKDMIRELGAPVKISQLKLKSDYVNFLVGYYSSQMVDKNSEPIIANESIVDPPIGRSSADPPVRRKKTRTMPPLDSKVLATTEPKTSNDTLVHLSPKDIIFEQCLRRYPPLRNLQAAIERQNYESEDGTISTHMNPNFYRSFTGLGEMDVRQKYHPMLANMTSSDLDLVTVGTASCVPGVTRGVSCTALRLQWRRNSGNTRDSRGGSPTTGPATGGIWIFDCGESTQVRMNIMY